MLSNKKNNFNYVEVKAKYLEQVDEMLMKKPPRVIDRVRLAKLVKTILHAKHMAESCVPLSPTQIRDLTNFDIVTTNGSTLTPIKARKTKNDPIIAYIACEDAFDLLLEAHRATGHGGMDKIKQYIKEKYVINKQCIEIFLPLCCNPDGIVKYNQRVSVSSFQIIYFPDKPFYRILIVRDLGTGLIHLRPIMGKRGGPAEISIELFKIFTDFGCPPIIEVVTLDDFEHIIGILKTLIPKVDIKIQVTKQCDEQMIRQIRKYFWLWIQSTQSENWALGCLVVQWIINNTRQAETESTPFTKVYGFMYSDPLNFRLTSNQIVRIPKLPDNSNNSETFDQIPSTACNLAVPDNTVTTNSNAQHIECPPKTVQTKLPNDPVISNSNSKSKFNTAFESFIQSYTGEQNPCESVPNKRKRRTHQDILRTEKLFQDENAKISLVSVVLSDDEIDNE